MRSAPLLGERTRRRLSFLINFLFWALWICLLFAAGRLLTRLLMPFVAAFLLAALLQQPLHFLKDRYHWRHGFAAAALVLVSLLLIGGVLGAVCWQSGLWLLRLFRQEDTLPLLQQFGGRLEETLRLLSERLSSLLPDELAALLDRAGNDAGDMLYSLSADLLSRLSSAAMSFATESLPRLLLAALFFILASIFFTRDYTAVVSFLKRQIPPPQRPLAQAALRALKETFSGVVRAYLLLGVLTFLELAAGFSLLRVPHPLLLAAITALVDILPILGVGTVLLPFAVFRLLTGNITGGILMLLLYGVVAAVRNLLQPKLISKQTGLPPLLTLLTMYAGWRAAGLIGLLTAPVLAMVLLRLQREGYLHIFR